MKRRIKKVIALLLSISLMMGMVGCKGLETAESVAGGKKSSLSDVKDLSSGSLYVFSDKKGKTIKENMKNPPEHPIYFKCPMKNYSFKGEEVTDAPLFARAIWFEGNSDQSIPTLTSKDSLLYISDTAVPDVIHFERFYDNGYTIGVSNLMANESEHYYIPFAETSEDDYIHYIDIKSDAGALSRLAGISRLYLDKVDGKRIDNKSVSKGGCVKGLRKNSEVVCEFYTGTYYQDYKLKANVHTFTSYENFLSYEFEFLHSNCIEIKIPDYFVSGYYMVNGLGLFRYIADGDVATFKSGRKVKYNKPLIIYDENGFVIFDPSQKEESDAGVEQSEIEVSDDSAQSDDADIEKKDEVEGEEKEADDE